MSHWTGIIQTIKSKGHAYPVYTSSNVHGECRIEINGISRYDLHHASATLSRLVQLGKGITWAEPKMCGITTLNRAQVRAYGAALSLLHRQDPDRNFCDVVIGTTEY